MFWPHRTLPCRQWWATQLIHWLSQNQEHAILLRKGPLENQNLTQQDGKTAKDEYVCKNMHVTGQGSLSFVKEGKCEHVRGVALTCGKTTGVMTTSDRTRFSTHNHRRNLKKDATLDPKCPGIREREREREREGERKGGGEGGREGRRGEREREREREKKGWPNK